eukprot:16431496-Heterocapsa_arctica.AAC.1
MAAAQSRSGKERHAGFRQESRECKDPREQQPVCAEDGEQATIRCYRREQGCEGQWKGATDKGGQPGPRLVSDRHDQGAHAAPD